MGESTAYAIRRGSLKVVSDDGVTLLGDVEDVTVFVDNGYDLHDFSYNGYKDFPKSATYRITGDFVSNDSGKFLTIISPKTTVGMTARVEIKENTLPAISAAHKASGAPEDATMEVVKGLRLDNLEDQWVVTFKWEEQK